MRALGSLIPPLPPTPHSPAPGSVSLGDGGEGAWDPPLFTEPPHPRRR